MAAAGGTINNQQGVHYKIDFFTLLPPELVLHIILYLPLKHLLPCMNVSRTWLSILNGMEPYWKQACEDLGLSSQLLEKLLTCYHTAKTALFAVLEHRLSIFKSHPRQKQLGSKYPYFMHYMCQYTKGKHLVGTIYKDFRPYKILIERIERDALQGVLTISPSYPKIAENRTIWVHIHNQYLFCAAGSGIWSVYNMKSTTAILQWKAPPMYDLEIKFACCDRCSMVCTAKLVTNHLEDSVCQNFWVIQVAEVCTESLDSTQQAPIPRLTKFKLKADNEDITSRRRDYGKKKVSLLSQSTEADIYGVYGLCSSHLLLLQWGNTIVCHVLHWRMKGKQRTLRLSQTPEKCFTAECRKSDFDRAIMRNRGLNTEFVLTEDNGLIGLIFQSQLVTWETKSSHLSSSVRISLENYSYEEMKLISLGHIYSIIGLEFSGTLMIVTTRTGQQILKYNNFALQHSQMVSPYIEFFSPDQEKWLSDITHPCETMLTYWNKTSRSVEGVELGNMSLDVSIAPAAKVKKRHWWHRK